MVNIITRVKYYDLKTIINWSHCSPLLEKTQIRENQNLIPQINTSESKRIPSNINFQNFKNTGLQGSTIQVFIYNRFTGFNITGFYIQQVYRFFFMYRTQPYYGGVHVESCFWGRRYTTNVPPLSL